MRRLAGALALTAAALAVFFLVEGFASVLLVLDQLVFHPQVVLTERAHCRYDELLGWVQLPNLDVPDLYGPGSYLRTNSQGFRGTREFAPEVPPDWTRIVCSGDSFTLGYGVDDDHAWCQLLATLGSRVESVNMGQGGYGLDQAYLWYMRDGKALQHQVHVFAFNTGDFQRMASDNFFGYGRPVVRVANGELTVGNVPVPRRSYVLPWLTQNARTLVRLRSFQVMTRLLKKLHLGTPAGVSDRELRAVATRIFETLRDVNRAKGSMLVLVYLPTWPDYDRGDSDAWRAWTSAEAARLELPFIDLVREYRGLTPEDARAMFSPVNGHYSVAGNERVARVIHARLAELRAPSPPVAGRE